MRLLDSGIGLIAYCGIPPGPGESVLLLRMAPAAHRKHRSLWRTADPIVALVGTGIGIGASTPQ